MKVDWILLRRSFARRLLLRRVVFIIAFLCAAVLLIPAARVSAHGSTQVGDYNLEIGFKNEPALQSEPNGLELIVTNAKTNQPVAGLESTLQAEVIFGASKKTLKIEPVEGVPGDYTAFLIPTETGDYTWHIFGKIENTPVNVSMTSSPSTFASVEPVSDVSFPGSEPSISALQADLASARQGALVGIVTGIVGILLGMLALVITLARGRRG